MTALLHPGVYVSEVPSGARSIEGAPTSTTIFVGETERGPIGPTKIASRSDYERLFGGYFRVRESTAPSRHRPGCSRPTRWTASTRTAARRPNRAGHGLRPRGARRPRARQHRRELARRLGKLLVGRVPEVERRPVEPLPDRRRLRVPSPAVSADIVEVWDRLSTDPATRTTSSTCCPQPYIRWNTWQRRLSRARPSGVAHRTAHRGERQHRRGRDPPGRHRRRGRPSAATTPC